jgi:drug/metabolite transporter (DMT)-like permease
VGEKVSRLAWLGLALGLAGAALAIAARSKIEAESTTGVMLTVLALFGITSGTLWEKRFGVSHHPVAANFIQYAVVAACTLPVAYATEGMSVDWTWEFAGVMVYLVVGNSLVAMTLLLAMIRAGEVARVSALFYLVPSMSALFAWPMLGEAMPPVAWAGMALSALGVAMASRRR